jgi:hypothetical protein
MSGLEQALQESGLIEKYAGSNLPRRRANNEFDSRTDSNNGGERDLHGAKAPNFVIGQETPEHRFLLYLFAQGNSSKDVFVALGGQLDPVTKQPVPGTGKYSYHWVCQIRRQAWFREQLTQFLHETGKDLVQAKLQTEVIPSLDVVLSIRDNEDAPSNVRLTAANSLIDRFLGKPTQVVQQLAPASVAKFESDAETLERQIAQVEEEMKSLNAATVPMLNQ